MIHMQLTQAEGSGTELHAPHESGKVASGRHSAGKRQRAAACQQSPTGPAGR